MTRLYLIRHAQTDHVLEKKYCGFTDPPLNDIGIGQAVRLKECMQDVRIDKIYSSDLKRAYQTADLIFENCEIIKCESFREMNFGIFENMDCNEISEKYPDYYDNWLDNMIDMRIENGESMQDLKKRVLSELNRIIIENKDNTIALVAHGGPNRIVMCEALGYGLNKFWNVSQKHSAYNIIDYDENMKATVVKMNEAEHLEKIED